MFASEVVAKQCGAVKRCANHMSEDMQSGTYGSAFAAIILLCY